MTIRQTKHRRSTARHSGSPPISLPSLARSSAWTSRQRRRPTRLRGAILVCTGHAAAAGGLSTAHHAPMELTGFCLLTFVYTPAQVRLDPASFVAPSRCFYFTLRVMDASIMAIIT
ncbi:unnamed protein product [Periconia digitata]|uniref:Uncharacterized protein n=1 Tax=Periconia digitata TaxID=1303443 RepID=A0A9W4UKB3_9PLEO|nr:unnamed protein product [Periconia digitata]